jgi:YhcH/YjgK/YiaL family protein
MIIDALENINRYAALHPSFPTAISYLLSTDLAGLEIGKFEVDGVAIKAIVSDKPGKKAEESLAGFECHNQYIDIQICIRGNETLGWKPRNTCLHPKGAYNEAKDVLLFDDKPDLFFQLTNGQFAIFFPEDVHAPMIGDPEPIKKLVLKIKI